MDFLKMFEDFKQIYSDFETCVILLKYQSSFLILKRGSTAPWMPNKWSLVGGGLDKGETKFECIERETLEEISLKPFKIKLKESKKTEDIGIIHYFTGELKTNKVKLDYENSEFKFIRTLDDIELYEFVPYIKEFITKEMK